MPFACFWSVVVRMVRDALCDLRGNEDEDEDEDDDDDDDADADDADVNVFVARFSCRACTAFLEFAGEEEAPQQPAWKPPSRARATANRKWRIIQSAKPHPRKNSARKHPSRASATANREWRIIQSARPHPTKNAARCA